MRIIDADEVVKFYKNMGKEFPELSAGVHFSINDIINNLDNIDTVKNVHFGGKTAMTKYSDIEIQTAQNLLKKGYRWLYRSNFGTLYAYQTKPIINKANYGAHYDILCKSYVPILQSVKSCDEPVSLESIVHPQILDDVERRYLSAVIRPFKDKVLCIAKRSFKGDLTLEYISIQLAGIEYTCLPRFKKGTMYKGMELDHWYTLKELGL